MTSNVPYVMFPRSSGTAGPGWLQGLISTLWAGTLQEYPTLRPRKICMNPLMEARSWAWPLASLPWKSFHSEWLPTTKPKKPWTSMIQKGMFSEENSLINICTIGMLRQIFILSKILQGILTCSELEWESLEGQDLVLHILCSLKL